MCVCVCVCVLWKCYVFSVFLFNVILLAANNLAIFMCRLSKTSWNPQSLSRPVMGLVFSVYAPYSGVT
jgi:hypothetical protein